MERARLARVAPAIRGAPSFYGAIDQIRYAARNRLCVEITYHDAVRMTEPYSLRVAKTGNMLLYVHEILKNGAPTGDTRAYKVNEIRSARVTEEPFQPRYRVEL